jgi:hypothetical protein
VVSDELVKQTCQEVGHRSRKRKITPVVTLLPLIAAIQHVIERIVPIHAQCATVVP